jgi:nitrite reductase (NO-forming)
MPLAPTARAFEIAFVTLALLSGCRAGSPSKTSVQDQRQPTTAAPTATAADISHGEAPIGAPGAPAPISPVAPPRVAAHLKQVRLEISHAPITVDEGVTYDAWTFGGGVPGPALRATVGDTVDFTLVNKAPMPHSMDFHAAEIAPSRYYTNVNPGDSIHYRFVPKVAGVFMYHCGTAPVAAHIANGMYGAFVVDPLVPRPKAHEFVLVQSEFYLTPADTTHPARSLDWPKVLDQAPDYVVFNGRSAQYAKHPISVPVGDLVRIYIVNAGPNRVSSFHVVGGIFERAFLDGSASATLTGVQTVMVPVGGGAIFEIRLREAGTYPFVTHAFADATKGAVGMLEAGKP